MNKRTKIINGTIADILNKQDKGGNDYIIVKLKTKEEEFGSVGKSIFAFKTRFPESRGNELEKDVEYNFICEEGKNGEVDILTDVEKVGSDIFI